ncbi:MAG: rhamnulokinase family protein [Chloroflexota bacterium]
MTNRTVLAVDLGAESGRVMAAHFDGETIRMEEVQRFPNSAVIVNGTRYWNFLSLWSHIQQGIHKGLAQHPASLGVDTWAIDFGLLDRNGNLLGNVVQYRDSRTDGMMDAVFKCVPKADVFAQTGIQFMQINTLYQLMSLVESQSPLLGVAETFLTVPDLLNYWLTGEKVCEFSNATTTQLYDPVKGNWADDLMARLNIPRKIFPAIVMPGTRLGTYEGVPVIAPATHDTGSAVAGVPATNDNYAYLSSGTWSLFGLETQHPTINAAALAANVTNEGGVYGTFRLLKNVMGLWLMQQCRAIWAEQGEDYDYGALTEMAKSAPALISLIDPDNPIFLPPGDHPAHVRELCKQSGQPVPDNKGAQVRCILESLAIKYRYVLDKLIGLTGQTVDVIHIIGGGSQNQLLCQMTADATGRLVLAGPVEATALGNALVQFITLGDLSNIGEAREVVARSSQLMRYEPQQQDLWNEAYERFISLWVL